MRKMNRAAFLALLTISMIGRLAFAQNPPTLLVVPSKATMLVGETRTFRAVGKDGRKQQNVTWNVSPENAATLTTDGDEATLRANEPSATVVLTAHAGDHSAQSSIEIHSGPDLYVEEACPDGTYVRPMTADGREIWRRRLGDLAAPSQPSLSSKEKTQPAEHLNLSAHSLCDDVSSGMTKNAVSKLAQDRNLRLEDKERESNSWMIEEQHFQCRIMFNETETVVAKKKKIISTD